VSLTAIEFSTSATLLGTFGLLMAALFAWLMLTGILARRRAAASVAAMPPIRDALIAYLAGSNDLSPLRGFSQTNRKELASAILALQGTVGGGALDRLCDVAVSLGLVQEWIREAHTREPAPRRAAYARLAFVWVYEPCRRLGGDLLVQALDDADSDVRLLAARALTQAGVAREIEHVFELAISRNLLIRILLTEDLRRHAVALCERVVPVALRSEESARVLATLDILVAWERAIPFENMRELLEHRDKGIRIQALRLAPLVRLAPENRAAIVRSLADPDIEVSSTAALTAARLRIVEALPSLARLLRVAPAELARTAATALAEMPPRGWETLEELSANSSPVTAAAAREALAVAREKAGT